MRARSPIDAPPQDPDPLDANVGQAGVWGMPGHQIGEGPAGLPPELFDYAAGILVGHGEEADAQAPTGHPTLLKAPSQVPPSYQVAHESTHRRFEPPRVVQISQAAAGFSLLAPALGGLHYIKLLALFLTLDAAGTIQFVQGSNDGTSTAAISGTMNMGGAAVPPLALQPAPIENPWFFTSPDQALGIFTVTGKAQGFALFCYSPYEA